MFWYYKKTTNTTNSRPGRQCGYSGYCSDLFSEYFNDCNFLDMKTNSRPYFWAGVKNVKK